ncbi:hypothetical protein CEXT_46851, partial [Caerostris extrusa]
PITSRWQILLLLEDIFAGNYKYPEKSRLSNTRTWISALCSSTAGLFGFEYGIRLISKTSGFLLHIDFKDLLIVWPDFREYFYSQEFQSFSRFAIFSKNAQSHHAGRSNSYWRIFLQATINIPKSRVCPTQQHGYPHYAHAGLFGFVYGIRLDFKDF